MSPARVLAGEREIYNIPIDYKTLDMTEEIRVIVITGNELGANVKYLDASSEENAKFPDGHPHVEGDEPIPLTLGRSLVFEKDIEEKQE